MKVSATLVLTGILAFLAFIFVYTAQDPSNVALRQLFKGVAFIGVGAITILAAARVGLAMQFRLTLAGVGLVLVVIGGSMI